MLTHIESLIHKYIPSSKIFMFGSTANRLAFPGSDIDVLVVENSISFDRLYNDVHQILYQSGEFEYVEAIRSTTVPVIQASHQKTGISMDIVINAEDGLKGLSLVMSL
jgi:DNA polymerase sigma